MKYFICLVMFFGGFDASYATTDKVADANSQVARIDAALRGKGVLNLAVKEEINAGDNPNEGVPPQIQFSTLSGKLVAARFHVGHEIWGSTVTVYFYDDGKPLKYLRVIEGQQSKSERQSIIYAPDGTVIWKNVDVPLVDPSGIQSVYKAIESLRQASADY